jgi:large subunit ribosomal protein L13
MTHTLDATNQSLGRLASQIALLLMGKNNPTYQPHIMPQEKVVIENITKLRFTGGKDAKKSYYHYSGFPGGMKSEVLQKLFARKPQKVLWLSVYRMLPKNRLRSRIIRNLDIK